MLSKNEDSPSDKAIIETYNKLRIKNFKIHSFLKRGSDERQYNSPGVDFPITSIFRTRYGDYPEYHTSLDNFNIVTYKGISGGFDVAKNAIDILQEKIYPKYKIICEPQMGKRQLYHSISIKNSHSTKDMMNVLTYSDGNNSIIDIANIC